MSEKKYDETNRGKLWYNMKKDKDSSPDMTGSMNVDGEEYWVNAWSKKSDNSKAPVITFSIKKKDVKRDGPEESKVTYKKPEPFDTDDIPF